MSSQEAHTEGATQILSTRNVSPDMTNSYQASGCVLRFHENTSSWTTLDDKCQYEDDFSHYSLGPVRTRTSLLTWELQGIRAHRLGTTTVGAYLKVLCANVRTMQYFDPIYTSIMIGLDSQSIVNTHTIFKDRHYMCDVLLCAIVHAGHISHITVDYV